MNLDSPAGREAEWLSDVHAVSPNHDGSKGVIKAGGRWSGSIVTCPECGLRSYKSPSEMKKLPEGRLTRCRSDHWDGKGRS